MKITCARCGRKLTAKASLTRGVGRYCASKIRAKAAQTVNAHKPASVAKALALIADAGIIKPARGTFWTTVSSDGRTTYRTDTQSCTCQAGVNGRECYHKVAVRLLAA